MNPNDFLDLASELVGGTREAEWRSGVSRAYYAAFHTARDLLCHCGFAVPASDRAHAYLWLRLANCGHPLVSRAGDRLQDLRRQRNHADYDLDQPFGEADAVHHFNVASDVVRLLEEVPTVPATMARITDTMRTYERDVLGEVTWQPPPP
jgi:uncharacterized protein (UPF0332 family)